MALLVYLNDIILTGSDLTTTKSSKTMLDVRFKLKGLGDLKYFLGFKIARSNKGISIIQMHYALQLLEDTGYLACKPRSIPIGQIFLLQ